MKTAFILLCISVSSFGQTQTITTPPNALAKPESFKQTQTAIGITQSKKIWGDDTKYSVYIGIFVALPKNDPAFFPKCNEFNFTAIKGAYNEEVARLSEKYPDKKFREVVLRYPSPMKGQITQYIEIELTFDKFKEIVCK